MPASPYLVPGFYDKALAAGRHREIVGGRWDETSRLQLSLLLTEGLAPHHHLLDIGCGSLRLGCRAVPYLDPGHYWGTDPSRPLMMQGRAVELADPDRLPPQNLVEDHDFTLQGIPSHIDFAIAFGVFPHLPHAALGTALQSLARTQDNLQAFLFTVFLAPEGAPQPLRQPDGVVTHPDRAPRHVTEAAVHDSAQAADFQVQRRLDMLPRGQVLFVATLANRAAKGR
jgi:SAM-dependent methyltransferase